MKKKDRITSIICAFWGLYISLEGYHLKLGTFRVPGVGFIIFWAGLILTGLSLALFVGTFFGEQEEGGINLWKGRLWLKGVKFMMALFIYTLVFRWLGFLLSTFLLLLYLFKFLEPQRWSVAILLSICTMAICYLVFGVGLGLYFPEGILGKVFITMH